MPFEQRDLKQSENLLRALKKARYDLEGLEVLSMAEVMKWVAAKLIPEITAQVQAATAKEEAKKMTDSQKGAELAGSVMKSKRRTKKKQGGK